LRSQERGLAEIHHRVFIRFGVGGRFSHPVQTVGLSGHLQATGSHPRERQ
jgi:hypothetical protein